MLSKSHFHRFLQNIARRLGHGHHGPNMPPFARLRPPVQMIHEETELVWDDSVAPEATIDFDAPHVSSRDVLLAFFSAFGFFGSVLALVYISDPEARNPVARRSAVISNESFLYSVGLRDCAPEEEE